MKFVHTKLDNGLEVVAEINENAYSMAIGFFVRTGSRDETDELSGVSHFLEHMLFKGTNRRSAEQVNRELDEMGGRANAFTSDEMTVYYAVVLPELQHGIVDLLADMMRPALRESDFETEKKVIIEEIRMYADQPPFGIDDKCRQLFFGKHPLSRSVLGTVESVGGLTATMMREYFDRRYSPGNIVVGVTGNVDFDALVKQLEEQTKSWRPYECARRVEAVKGSHGRHIFTRANATQEYVFMTSDGPCIVDDDRYPSALLSCIVGDDAGSRMFWALLDSGKADTACLTYTELQDAGCFTSVLYCSPESTHENLEIMRNILADVQKNGVGEDELRRARNKFLTRCVISGERPRGRLFPVGMEWLQTGKYSSVQDDIALINGITLDDIHQVLTRYPLDNPMLVAIGPLDDF